MTQPGWRRPNDHDRQLPRRARLLAVAPLLVAALTGCGSGPHGTQSLSLYGQRIATSDLDSALAELCSIATHPPPAAQQSGVFYAGPHNALHLLVALDVEHGHAGDGRTLNDAMLRYEGDVAASSPAPSDAPDARSLVRAAEAALAVLGPQPPGCAV